MLLRECSERLASIMDDGARRARIYGMGWSQAHEVIAGVTVNSIQGKVRWLRSRPESKSNNQQQNRIFFAERERP